MRFIKGLFGFIITTFLILNLIAGSMILGLNNGLLKGDDVEEVLEDIKFYPVLDDMTMMFLTESFEEAHGGGSVYLEDIPEDIVSRATKEIVHSLNSGEKADLGFMVEYSGIVSVAVSNVIVDSMYDEAQNETISVKEFMDSAWDESYSEEIGVDLDELLIEILGEDNYSEEILLSDAIDAVGTDNIKSALDKGIDELVHLDLEGSENLLNEAANDFLENDEDAQSLRELFEAINNYIRTFKRSAVVILVLSIIWIILLIVLYHKEIYGGTRNIAIACGFASFNLFIMAAGGKVASSEIKKEAAKELSSEYGLTSENIPDFVATVIGKVFSPLYVFAVIFLIVMIGLIVASIILKKRYKALHS